MTIATDFRAAAKLALAHMPSAKRECYHAGWARCEARIRSHKWPKATRDFEVRHTLEKAREDYLAALVAGSLPEACEEAVGSPQVAKRTKEEPNE